MMRFSRFVPLCAGLAMLLSPAVAAQQATPVPATEFGSLRFIGEQRIPNDATFDDVQIGGLSGIDYNQETGEWVVISDDRSEHGPARFYTAELDYDAEAFNGVEITGQTPLLQADGAPYEGGGEGSRVPDAESIRFDPFEAGTLWWSGEGDSALGWDPTIVQVDASGQQIGAFAMPPMFAADPNEASGARTNAGFEAMTFSAGGETLWVLPETALIQDGPIATLEQGATSRLTQFDRDGNVLAQYAYELDPIQAEPTGEDADNGVVEIVAVDETRFLVMERSGVSAAEGPWDLYIRIYLIDITGATDVSRLDSLEEADYTPVSKELVLNLAESELEYADNIEGMSWGPALANGNATLVLVSDNNFNDATQVTQFLAYEVVRR
jgi:hypothetical protein